MDWLIFTNHRKTVDWNAFGLKMYSFGVLTYRFLSAISKK